MQGIMDGHNSGDGIITAEKHDKALEMLKEQIKITESVTLLAKLFQNAELKYPAFDRLCYLGFDKKVPEALNEILQITQQAKNKALMTAKNRKNFLKEKKEKK